MVKKKQEEEHENAERWMVSYADFMTLLFATFVVLYALAQIDIKEFDKLEESIKAAFNSSGPIAGGQDPMNGIGQTIIQSGAAPETNSLIPPIMEFLSPAYEKNSMEAIKKEIEKELKAGNIEGVSASLTDRGLVITLNDINAFFASGSAELSPSAQKVVNSIGKMIKKKFNNHLIRIEGHTDNIPINKNSIYPSNWELSAARSASVARFLIEKYNITPNLFTIIGYGETKPLDTNSTIEGREKNRRIEIVVLKNQLAKYEPSGSEAISPQNLKQEQIKQKNHLSDAAKKLLETDGTNENQSGNVIILDEYNNPRNADIKKAISDFEQERIENKKKFTNR